MSRVTGVFFALSFAALVVSNSATVFSACPQSEVDLGDAEFYTVLGATTVTNTGPTTVDSNVGVSPGTAVTGFPPGIVSNGGITVGATDPAAAGIAAVGETPTLALLFLRSNTEPCSACVFCKVAF
eukprot:874919-Rhodomonas_salina.3